MSDTPYLAINWAGATDDDKAKALAAINAAFAAIGMTAAEGALASFAREGEELAYDVAEDSDTVTSTVTSEQRDAADLWMGMEELAVAALGMKPGQDRLPDFVNWIEPWVTAEQAQQAVDSHHRQF